MVLALPRGGIPVGLEVATKLNAPLDVCVVRRIELPDSGGFLNLTLAGGRLVVSDMERTQNIKMSENALFRILEKETREVARRQRAYRGDYPEIVIAGRSVLLVDDGLAAPDALIAAAAVARALAAVRLVVAVPVATGPSYRQLLRFVDEIVCLEVASPLHGIGASYADFAEVSDLDVRSLHEAARNRLADALG